MSIAGTCLKEYCLPQQNIPEVELEENSNDNLRGISHESNNTLLTNNGYLLTDDQKDVYITILGSVGAEIGENCTWCTWRGN